ncbi:MAG: hypothetical protein SO181_08485 [Frisingicoccus sp.]|uniref:hypothetical protein n=1 Tax=Frisingicoccus sp. TaxID=1918627 RepID=UPI002A81D3B8|nr:hypothetical protein [Frisingicoccus sp.]MDY4835163.1 hypothetical protein [Frisingicoccus sp.]
MTRIKQFMALSIAAALSIPTMTYAAETKTYTQPIKDREQKQVGDFLCAQDTEAWTRSVVLNASVVPAKDQTLPEAEFLWTAGNETESVKGNTYTAETNGKYTVKMQMPQESGLTAEDIIVEIKNIDRTAPKIVTISRDIQEWTNKSVNVTVECVDYQDTAVTAQESENKAETTDVKEKSETKEMGTSEQEEPGTGSGLHPEGAYSYDGGQTWTKDNVIAVDENKTIAFVVRDALGNQATETITVDNIDKTRPTVSLSIADGGVLYEGEEGQVTLKASASDAASGLADKPYSWNGGVSWSEFPSYVITEAGNYTVLVRDRAGNTARAALEVTYTKRPEESEETTQPEETTVPEESSRPEETTVPENPSQPESPIQPETSAKPENPIQPENPSQPESPTQPENSQGIQSNTSQNPIYNIYYGNPEWENSNAFSGIVDLPLMENKTETKEETKKETETKKQTSESKKKETSQTKETEDLKVPVMDDHTSGFYLGWLFIALGLILAVIVVILIVKAISDRRKAMLAEDEDPEDMSQIYARVDEEAAKTIAVAAAEAEKEDTVDEAEKEKALDDVFGPVTDLPDTDSVSEDTVELEPITDEAVLAADVQALETEEPVVKKVERKKTPKAVSEDGSSPSTPPVIPVPAKEPKHEKVVLEGAHSRLVYDPETGEYTYEFK